MKSLNDVTPRRTASGIPSRMWGSWFRMKWKPKSSTERDSASSRSLTSAFGSVSPSSPTTNGTSVVSPVRAAAMGAVVQSSYSGPTWRWHSMSPGSTYFPAASITRAAGGSSDSGPIATIVSPLMATAASKTSEPVTTRPPRTRTSREGTVIGKAPSRSRAGGGARSAVADENDLRALERKRAIALWVAAILADRDPDPGAGGVEDLVARVAVGEVVGLEDLGEAVGGLGTGEVDLAERPAESAVPIGEERCVEVFPLRLLAEAHMHRDPRLGRAAQERLERLRRHFGLEELVEVGADLLGEVRRERHLGIGDQLDAFSDRLGEQAQHALDNLLAACALVIRAHLGGGDLYMAYIYTAYIARHAIHLLMLMRARGFGLTYTDVNVHQSALPGEAPVTSTLDPSASPGRRAPEPQGLPRSDSRDSPDLRLPVRGPP